MDGGVCRLLLREGEGIGKVLGDFSSSGGCTMPLAWAGGGDLCDCSVSVSGDRPI
jgi:hypothetical protein